jgi:acetolactate synthase-1/2/3 large subunit
MIGSVGADRLADALRSAGTKLLFGVPGGGSNLDVVGACEAAGIDFVLVHSETAAAVMAGVVGELTGAPGACVVTRGPGAASAVNGAAQALLDRQPLLLITDCVTENERDRVSHQRIDQTSMMAPVTKASLRLGPLDDHLAKAAVELALTGRPGPIHIDLDPTIGVESGALLSDHGRAGDLSAVTTLLRSAQRPVVVAGVGVTALEASRRAAFAAAIDQLLAGAPLPVLTTYKARGVVDDLGPNAAGVATGATIESPVLHDADLIIGIGLDPVELIAAPWAYDAPVVLLGGWAIDDSTFFGGHLAGEVVGDLAELVAQLAGVLRPHWEPDQARRYRERSITEINAAVPDTPVGLTPQQVVQIAAAVAPVGTVATVDAGAHMLAAVPLWPARYPRQVLISSGLATMGFSLPAAVAASLVDPSRHVVCFTGDGGIGMVLAELETLARLGAKAVVVVFNDATLSLIAIKQQPHGHGGVPAVGYAPTDFAAIAIGCGLRGERIVDTSTYSAALSRAFAHDGPTLLDVQVDPSGYPKLLAAIRG